MSVPLGLGRAGGGSRHPVIGYSLSPSLTAGKLCIERRLALLTGHLCLTSWRPGLWCRKDWTFSADPWGREQCAGRAKETSLWP